MDVGKKFIYDKKQIGRDKNEVNVMHFKTLETDAL